MSIVVIEDQMMMVRNRHKVRKNTKMKAIKVATKKYQRMIVRNRHKVREKTQMNSIKVNPMGLRIHADIDLKDYAESRKKKENLHNLRGCAIKDLRVVREGIRPRPQSVAHPEKEKRANRALSI
mmetsp:Transcript_17189/g.42160  ORF Transcript_17189/g.42160 Transcript_17189/m.42160 type:complete len:124 (-) Transcript_17189:559-930(-)